jgi:tetratricopeptide (TPR) repeat protein
MVLWIVLGFVLLALLVFNPIGCAFLSVFVGMGYIKVTEAKLQKREVYEPVARRLAVYCQSDQSLFPEYLSYAWLPEELAKVGHGRCRVSTNAASVEMGGGFYHFGYHLRLDEAESNSNTNVWQLCLYREGSEKDTHLLTLSLASTQHVSSAELEKLTSSGFDAAVKRGNSETYQGKVMLKLRFGETAEAADVCQEWIKREPNSWLPRFTYAHVRCRLGQIEPASAEFTQWVQSHKNFAHCIYLALFEFREGRTNQALTGVRLALSQPFVEPSGTDGNKFYLGHNGALIAYLDGDYDLASSMCDKMLSDSRQEIWWGRKVQRLKAAVMLMKGDQSAAKELMKQAEASQDKGMTFSVDGMVQSDRKLRAAIESRDLAFVKNPANWSDQLEGWFSPFETDETGIHNAVNIPTPYPKSWTTDRLNPADD